METYCEESQRKILYQLPNFFRSLGKMAADERPSNFYLYFGIVYFPNGPIFTPTLASNPPWLLPTPVITKTQTNSYTEALRTVREKSSTQEIVVVLLTDGTYVDPEENFVLSELSQLGARNTAYVVLCNNDKKEREKSQQFWKKHTRKVYDLNEIENWFSEWTEELMGEFLPDREGKKGWLSDSEVKGMKKEVKIDDIPGHATFFTVKAVVLRRVEGQPRLGLQFQGREEFPIQEGMWPNSFQYSSNFLSPSQTCTPHQFTIRLHGSGIGFYWIVFGSSPISATASTIALNNMRTTISVTLESPELPHSILEDLASCYRVALQFENSSEACLLQFDEQFNEYNGRLLSEWGWQPNSQGEPRKVQAWAVLTTRSGEFIGRWPLDLQVKFSPQIITDALKFKDESSGQNCANHSYNLTFPVKYEPQEAPIPNVFLLVGAKTPSTEPYCKKDENGYNFSCNIFNSRGEYRVEIVNDGRVRPSANQPAFVRRTLEGGNRAYSLVMHPYLYKNCGANVIVFEWADSPSIKKTAWQCEFSVENNKLSCQKLDR